MPLIREEEKDSDDDERPAVPDKNTPRLGQSEEGRYKEWEGFEDGGGGNQGSGKPAFI